MQLIDFQRSMTSTQDSVWFTINIGGVPEPIDEWIVIDGRSNVERLAQQLLTHLKGFVLPSLDAHGTDAALAKLWPEGQSPGLTDFNRLLYLAVLLHDSGSQAALDSVIRELDQLTVGEPASAHVDYLRERLHQ